MSVEKRINELIKSKRGPIEGWRWTVQDQRRIEVDWMRDFNLNDNERRILSHLVGDPEDLVDEIILSSSTSECLTSSSEYIRERKRFSLKESL